jgi:hypothetical protein
MDNLKANDPASWLNTIWQALECHRENSIPEGDAQYDKQWGDICTAMAWISEELGVDNEAI